MQYQQIIGMGFLSLGLVSASSYTDDLASFRIPWFYQELEPMRQRWGKTAGTILHVLEYVIAPVSFGLLFLMGVVFS